MKHMIISLALAVAAFVSHPATANDVLNDSSEQVIITISGGLQELSIQEQFANEDLQGLVFGQLADIDEVPLADTFCVVDIPVKTVTVIDADGHQVDFRSSEQNCEGYDDHVAGFAPRYLDYRQLNRFLESLNLPVVHID